MSTNIEFTPMPVDILKNDQVEIARILDASMRADEPRVLFVKHLGMENMGVVELSGFKDLPEGQRRQSAMSLAGRMLRGHAEFAVIQRVPQETPTSS